jgi:hypothetical protein
MLDEGFDVGSPRCKQGRQTGDARFGVHSHRVDQLYFESRILPGA